MTGKHYQPDITTRGITSLSLSVKVPKITIHCVRHAQGYHNLNIANHQIHDPNLTPFGESQCIDLRKTFPYHEKITHLVASPLRRTIYTCLLGFEEEVKNGKKVIALPEAQETSDLPCDTGSDPEKLGEEFGTGPWKGIVDLSLVHEGWNDKSTDSRWAPNAAKIEVRAREARKWLRELGKQYGKDAEIVLVTHGGFLHYFTEDWTGHNKFEGTGWANTEFRSYSFRSENDESASVIELEESRERRKYTAKPLTEDEQRELRATAEIEHMDNGFISAQTKL